MSRISIIIVLVAIMLLATVLSWIKEEITPWKRYQRGYAALIKARQREDEFTIGRPDESPIENKIRRVGMGEHLIIQVRNEHGGSERCMTCHVGIEPISTSHQPGKVACSSCHGGDPLVLDERLAHEGMIRDAPRRCGQPECHSDLVKSFFHKDVNSCAECHYALGELGKYDGMDVTMIGSKSSVGGIHKITTAIGNDRCLKCHKPAADEHRETPKCVLSLSCIDCHSSDDVMTRDKNRIECQTCHSPRVAEIIDRKDPAMRIGNLNPYISNNLGDLMVVGKDDRKLPHVKKIGEKFILTDKATGKKFVIPINHD